MFILFGPTFRAENSNTSRHLAEFWMIEPEMAFCDLEGNVALAVEFLKYVFAHVLENCSEDMAFFNRFIDKSVIQTLESLVKQEFTTLTYTEGIKLLEKASVNFEFPIAWGSDIQSEHERYLCEEVFKGPVVLIDYPKDIKAFYMKMNEDEKPCAPWTCWCPRSVKSSAAASGKMTMMSSFRVYWKWASTRRTIGGIWSSESSARFPMRGSVSVLNG
jgi:asparaginyl-tRNA synthetase